WTTDSLDAVPTTGAHQTTNTPTTTRKLAAFAAANRKYPHWLLNPTATAPAHPPRPYPALRATVCTANQRARWPGVATWPISATSATDPVAFPTPASNAMTMRAHGEPTNK